MRRNKFAVMSCVLCSMLLACSARAPVYVQTSDVPGPVGAGGTASPANSGGPDTTSNPVRTGTAGTTAVGTMTTGTTGTTGTAGTTAGAVAVPMPGAAGVTGAVVSGGSASPSPAPVPMTPLPPIVIDQTDSKNPAGLSPAEVTKLVAGGPPAAMKMLYPYDGTVFPGGTIAPLVMWTGNSTPDAVYLHMKSQAFEYKGVLAPSTEGALFFPGDRSLQGDVNGIISAVGQEAKKQLAVPQTVWDAATQRSQGKGDVFLLEVTERVNGQIHGPVATHITIARGAVQGSIYYNICQAATVGQDNADPLGALGIGSRVMRIPPGGNAETVSNPAHCVGCHSVSANGSRMVAQRAPSAGDTVVGILDGSIYSRVYALSLPFGSDGKPDTMAETHVETKLGAYGALYPDGSKYLAPSGKFDAGHLGYIPGFNNGNAMLLPASDAELFDTMTGMAVSGTGIPTGVVMPNFSPDGRRLVFNDATMANAHGLALMDYDTRNHKATNYRMLLQDDPSGNVRPGWPFFLPDNGAIVFVQTASADFTSQGGNGSGLETQIAVSSSDPVAKNPSDLYIADIATGKLTMLAKAMGFNTPADAAAGKTYLPFGEADLHRSFYPTVSPVASGGYFWVFFDSLRTFGSLGSLRLVWGAAIDIHPDGSYTTDPSHPPFFLTGQEFVTGSHHRTFAALNQCKADGDKCSTGIDCCAGACNDFGTCAVPPPNTCAKVQERCASVADCCDAANYCINGFCSLVELL